MRVVVIGAGIIGVAIAEALSHRGAQVTVLDMRAPGAGATQAAAGILAPYVEGADSPELLDLGLRSLALYDQFITRLTDATGRPIEYARSGTLELALDDGDIERLESAARARLSAGAETTWFDAAAVHSVEPSATARALAGLHTARQGHVGARSLLGALLESARMNGAVFEAPVEVSSVQSDADEAVVRAGNRVYQADAVIVASGSWARRVRVANVAAVPVRPIRGQLLHLRWASASSPPPARVIWGPRCYAVPWADGSLLVGATSEDVGFDEHATAAGVAKLTAAAIELLPAAAESRVEAVRVGLRPALPDHVPAIGRLPRAPRVIAAVGHYRSGVLFAPLTADLVCQAVLDNRPPDLDLPSVSTARLFGKVGARLEV